MSLNLINFAIFLGIYAIFNKLNSDDKIANIYMGISIIIGLIGIFFDILEYFA